MPTASGGSLTLPLSFSVTQAKAARDAGIPCLALFPNTQPERRSEDGKLTFTIDEEQWQRGGEEKQQGVHVHRYELRSL